MSKKLNPRIPTYFIGISLLLICSYSAEKAGIKVSRMGWFAGVGIVAASAEGFLYRERSQEIMEDAGEDDEAEAANPFPFDLEDIKEVVHDGNRQVVQGINGYNGRKLSEAVQEINTYSSSQVQRVANEFRRVNSPLPQPISPPPAPPSSITPQPSPPTISSEIVNAASDRLPPGAYGEGEVDAWDAD